MILWDQDMPIFQRLIKDLFPGAVSGAEDLKMRCFHDHTRWHHFIRFAQRTRQIVLICPHVSCHFLEIRLWSFNMFQHLISPADPAVIFGSQLGAPHSTNPPWVRVRLQRKNRKNRNLRSKSQTCRRKRRNGWMKRWSRWPMRLRWNFFRIWSPFWHINWSDWINPILVSDTFFLLGIFVVMDLPRTTAWTITISFKYRNLWQSRKHKSSQKALLLHGTRTREVAAIFGPTQTTFGPFPDISSSVRKPSNHHPSPSVMRKPWTRSTRSASGRQLLKS